MVSIQAHIINRYLAKTMKPLPLAQMEPEKIREVFDSAKTFPLPKDVFTYPVAAPVKGEWHCPPAVRPEDDTPRTVLYFHGGGYVFGSPKTHRPMTFALARGLNVPVFSLDYRLAPEHPCPAAVDDAEAAFEYLLSCGKRAGDIVVGGDSAGGGLTLALIQRLRDKGRDLPGRVFLFSPWTDLTSSGDSIDANEPTDFMFMAASVRDGAPRYGGILSLQNSEVSPLFGSFADLPPMLVFASSSECRFDDSVRRVDKARKAGVEVEFIEKPGLVHVWPLFTPVMPEANAALRRTLAFIRAD